MSDLADGVCMITGAGGNVGASVASLLTKRGSRLVLVDRSEPKLRERFPNLDDDTRHWFASGFDLTDPESSQQLVAEAIERFGSLYALVHTVGAYRGGSPLHETDPETLAMLLTVNLKTTFNMARAVTPHLLTAGSGRIVNVASSDALKGHAGVGPYAASKAGVLRLTEALAEEVKHAGVTVNAVMPGTIDTPQNRASQPQADFSQWVTPDQVAAVVAFLLSDDAAAVNGAAIPAFGRG